MDFALHTDGEESLLGGHKYGGVGELHESAGHPGGADQVPGGLPGL